MGMIGNYLRVSKTELEEYLKDSSKLEARVYNNENPNDPNLTDVDKAWEGIFFLLTGNGLSTAEQATPPLSWILDAPNQIDTNQDMGYGPASYTTIEQTKEISNNLNSISSEELKKRFNGKQMMELAIYPTVWDDHESLDYLVTYFNLLKDFYNKASSDNQVVIFFIN